METAAATTRLQSSDAFLRFLRAGLATAVIDGLFATVQTALSGSTFSRLWQGVASVVIGPSAFTGGIRTTALGIFMHCAVAFFWSAIFVFAVMPSTQIRKVLATRLGTLKVAAVYGPAVWLVMSLVVIPLLAHRPPKISSRWLVQLLGHIPFVGLPIVGFANGFASRRLNAARE
jgi:hypothetical protein